MRRILININSEPFTKSGGTKMKSKLIVILVLAVMIAAQIAPALAMVGDPSQWG